MVVVTFLFVRQDKGAFRFELQKIISKKYFVIIKRFSVMALLSAFVVPLTLLFIRNGIVKTYSIKEAGIWDAVNRLSSFYMIFFNSGLSLYYMPKLASIHTETEFKSELKSYFKVFVPLFLLMLIVIYFAKSIILNLAFTKEFSNINDLIIWQLAGDFVKILTLAFGFQIVVKTMMKRYFIGEIIFNLSYFIMAYYLMRDKAVEGVLQAYFYANIICLVVVLIMFRKLFYSTINTNR
jgi:PST family polysaccharide transporter